MKKKLLASILGVILLISLVGCGSKEDQTSGNSSSSSKETTKMAIALSSWVGYAPLYIAQEKGFFKKNGLDVKLIKMEAVADRRSALAANTIQGFASTVDTHVMTAAAGIPVQQVVALDDSYGGDGMVAKKDIKSLADLKGKKVGVQTDGGASYFWFLYMLDKNNIDVKDVKIQNMSAGDAGSAFVAKKLDAAVTWEPWLTNAKKTSFGHVLLDSKATPGVIEDTVAFRSDFIKKNPKAMKAFVKSWYQAVDYYKTHEADAISIMAKSTSQTSDEFKGAVSGVRYYDQAKNESYFGTKESPGQLMELTEKATKFWLKEDLIKKDPGADSLINYSFIK
ncbi:ABC transporter substrate-binding protein [Terrilactibacillus laevilacticus]|uniref:ABC transporter substrate-binding protein n=1 Tax=Terrilactibacillus laevilacticus TaxID=1380157 RepID=A0ABW5PNJ0_9BACI|nr:ABC transporter substrate-binding protein [Terrilactibacillus laevilacticus]